MRLRFSARAGKDLAKITRDIRASNGPLVATEFVADLQRSVANLRDFPFLDSSRNELGRGIRLWPHSPFNVYYRVGGEDVEVVCVLHGRRRVTRKLLRSDDD